MPENAEKLGQIFRSRLNSIQSEHLDHVRGKGLMNALVFRESDSFTANGFAWRLKEAGILCKPTHGHILRVAPPLCISSEQMEECMDIIERTLLS